MFQARIFSFELYSQIMQFGETHTITSFCCRIRSDIDHMIEAILRGGFHWLLKTCQYFFVDNRIERHHYIKPWTVRVIIFMRNRKPLTQVL